MSKLLTTQQKTGSPEATERIGEAIGKRMHGGELLELVSDLGGGKTTFVKGLARGMGSADRVASPTFTISREYKAGDKTLYHFDFYRLQEAGIVANELEEVSHNPHASVVVEWGDVVADVLPTKRLTIAIKVASENEREIIFSYPEPLAYLLQAKDET